MRPDEVAELFRVTVRTLMNWWKSGETCLVGWHPSHKVAGGKGLLFTSESVVAFQKQGQIAPEEWEEPPPVVVKKISY